MIHVFLASMLSAAAIFGAPYPDAQVQGAVDHGQCATRYQLRTTDSISQVAQFYAAEAAAAKVPLLDDTGSKFADYRTLTFVKQPHFMFVLIDRKGNATDIRVAYTNTLAPGCK
jgi:hypothetical protein